MTIDGSIDHSLRFGGPLPPRFSPLDPAVQHDPYPTYARLRREAPICRGGPGQWVVSRHRDVAPLLRSRALGQQFPEEYHRFAAGSGPAGELFGRIVLYRDPPDHTRLRRLMGQILHPSRLHEITPRLSNLVDCVLDPAFERRHVDAASDLAHSLPVLVICELMGIPLSESESIQDYAIDLGRAFGTHVPADDRRRADVAVEWLRAYIGQLLELRARRPGEDFLSEVAAAHRGAEVRRELIDNLVFLFFAGFETTKNLIATGCAALLDHPDELCKLRRNPDLMSTAIDEFLRFDAPIQGVARMVKEPLQVAGRSIRPGRVLVLLLGSANRDPDVFVEPDTLDVSRTPNPHLSFGGGVHFCLGAPLARLEASLFFHRVLERSSSIDRGPAAPVREPNSRFRAYASVPISLHAA